MSFIFSAATLDLGCSQINRPNQAEKIFRSVYDRNGTGRIFRLCQTPRKKDHCLARFLAENNNTGDSICNIAVANARPKAKGTLCLRATYILDCPICHAFRPAMAALRGEE